MKKPTKDQSDLITRVVQLKHDLGAAGLYKSMHAMEYAVKAVGWEVADLIKHGSYVKPGRFEKSLRRNNARSKRRM